MNRYFLAFALLAASVCYVTNAAPRNKRAAISYSITVGNETRYGTSNNISNSSFEEFFMSILGGDAACSEDQLELVSNCTELVAEEYSSLDNETARILHLTWGKAGMMQTAKPSQTGDEQGFGPLGGSGLDNDPSSFNQTVIIDYFRSHPKESRAALDATCRGFSKLTQCAENVIGDTKCNPLVYRVPKAIKEVICEPDFFDLMSESMDCMADAAKNDEFEDCMNDFNQTTTEMFENMDSDELSGFGGLIAVAGNSARISSTDTIVELNFALFDVAESDRHKLEVRMQDWCGEPG